jgi:hypothetical protein
MVFEMTIISVNDFGVESGLFGEIKLTFVFDKGFGFEWIVFPVSLCNCRRNIQQYKSGKKEINL